MARRYMLHSHQLELKFWGEATFYAALIINRMPTRYVRHMTPFEKWYCYKPCVVLFEVFGSPAWAHVPKEKCNKLQPTSQHCILVGYIVTSGAYHLYDSFPPIRLLKEGVWSLRRFFSIVSTRILPHSYCRRFVSNFLCRSFSFKTWWSSYFGCFFQHFLYSDSIKNPRWVSYQWVFWYY